MISEYLGIDSDYIVIGLAALVLILIIVMIVNAAKMHSLKKAYNNFMTGCKKFRGHHFKKTGSGRTVDGVK